MSKISTVSKPDLPQHLVDQILGGHSHAQSVLLTGPPGAELLPLARYLATGWMCLAPTENGTACGECAACRTMSTQKAVDFQLIETAGKGGLIRLNKIVEVPADRDEDTIPILSFLRTRPLVARRKVVVIYPADRMTHEAANALLKTLEEPGPHARLILATSSPTALLATIKSRCLIIPVGMPTPEALHARFGELTSAERLFGEGSYERIETIRLKAEPYNALFGLCEGLAGQNKGSALRASERVREIAEEFGLGVRPGQAEALRCLGLWARSTECPQSHILGAIHETHRRILGNAHGAIQFDALFAQILS